MDVKTTTLSLETYNNCVAFSLLVFVCRCLSLIRNRLSAPGGQKLAAKARQGGVDVILTSTTPYMGTNA